MSGRRRPLGGARLVGFAALLLLAMAALILATAGSGEAGLRMLVRATARSSLLLFGAAFTASSLVRLFPHPETRWLLRERRYLGLSFAVSHALHLIAILALALVLGDAFTVDAVTLVFGGGAFGMIALMAATSSDRAVAWLGPRRWRALHGLGAWWVWIVFAFSYSGRGVESLVRGQESPVYLLPMLLVWAMLGARLAAFLRARRPAFA
jgi:hypothetical protein